MQSQIAQECHVAPKRLFCSRLLLFFRTAVTVWVTFFSSISASISLCESFNLNIFGTCHTFGDVRVPDRSTRGAGGGVCDSRGSLISLQTFRGRRQGLVPHAEELDKKVGELGWRNDCRGEILDTGRCEDRGCFQSSSSRQRAGCSTLLCGSKGGVLFAAPVRGCQNQHFSRFQTENFQRFSHWGGPFVQPCSLQMCGHDLRRDCVAV